MIVTKRDSRSIWLSRVESDLMISLTQSGASVLALMVLNSPVEMKLVILESIHSRLINSLRPSSWNLMIVR